MAGARPITFVALARASLRPVPARVARLMATSAATRRVLACVAWLGACALLGRLALDAGVTWDETFQSHYGDLILRWFQSGFRDRAATGYRNLYLYGGLFDLPAQWLISKHWLRLGPYEARHVLTAFVAVAGIAASYATAARIAGARAGLFAAALLALTPAWIGHGLFNPKDIPFGSAAAFVAYASVRIALGAAPLAWRDALLAGVCVGCALGVRSGGWFLFAFPVLAAIGRFFLRQDGCSAWLPGEWRKRVATLVLRLCAALAIAWCLMLAAWPWAQLHPIAAPLWAAREAAHFHWIGPVLFGGRIWSSDALPAAYLPVWFAITLPELYLAAALGAALCWRWRGARLARAQIWALLVLGAFVVLPIAGVLIARPILYDAQRHFLFLLPPLAALGGVAFARVFENAALPRAVRFGFGGLVLALAGLVASDMIALHPYEYVYFNRISGGLPAQVGRFETDYWGASYREGLAWVTQHVTRSRRGAPRISISGCYGCEDAIEYYLREWGLNGRYVFTGWTRPSEIFLAITRHACHLTSGRVLHVVERQGAPLLYVMQR